MEIKRILWPTDFSENAAKALPYVTLFSETFHFEAHVLYVLKKYGEWGLLMETSVNLIIKNAEMGAKDRRGTAQ